jgi:hypothetical protein
MKVSTLLDHSSTFVRFTPKAETYEMPLTYDLVRTRLSEVWAMVPGFGLEDQPNGNGIKTFLDRSALKSEQQIVPPPPTFKMQTQLCLKPLALFWLIAGILAPVILLINPIREMALGDDWGYALAVKNLVETGSFKSVDWATPSMPFQAYWGALFAHLLGYSFTSLRISTLVLMFLGLIAFYYLAREHRLDRFPGSSPRALLVLQSSCDGAQLQL